MHENMESISRQKKYAICTVAAAPVRKESSHKSEMVNQLVYGEAMEVLEEKEEWRFIKSLYDGYEGWLTFHLIDEVDESSAISKDVVFTSALLTEIVLKSGEKIFVPMGSFLKNKIANGSNTVVYNDGCTDGKKIIQTAKKWLHVPYLWGGKTAMGVDCSGFVQTVFKMHGIILQRDAYQQAEQGMKVLLKDAVAGDVAFFTNENSRITHVGILLNNKEIIHAAGRVRIDVMDENGIQNTELKKQTHPLHSVKRMHHFTGTS